MNERFPSDCLVMFWVIGLFVTYQLAAGTVAAAPLMVSHTRVVPAIRWPQPVVRPAGWQSSPPAMPPWNIFIGKMNDCRSPVQLPLLLVQVAPGAVQLITQRLRPPLLLPCQTRRLPISSPSRVPPRVPEPLKVRFALLMLENGIKFPALPQTTAVTTTLEPAVAAVTCDGISAFIACRISVAAVAKVVPTGTSPGLTRVATQVNVCVPTTNCWPTVPKVDTVIVPCACVHDVPIGSTCPEKPSPPRPICHCTGPVGVPAKVTELGPLSCAPPTAKGDGALAKLPLMSPA